MHCVRPTATWQIEGFGTANKSTRRVVELHVFRGAYGARVEELGEGHGVSSKLDAEASVQREREEPGQWVLREHFCFGLCTEQRKGGGRFWPSNGVAVVA